MASCSMRSFNTQATDKLFQKEDSILAFESLKACLTKLDHSPQNFKASVGRSGAHGQRRPPSRSSKANSIISSKSSTESFDCVDKETTLVLPKVVNIEIRLEDSGEVVSSVENPNKRFRLNQNIESEDLNSKFAARESFAKVETNSNFEPKEFHRTTDLQGPYISPILVRLLYNSKAYGRKYTRSDRNSLSVPSLTSPTYLKRSESTSSLSALDLNSSQIQQSQLSKNVEDFFDSQSHHSDSCLTSSVLLKNILNSFKNKKRPTYRDSSSDTEVVISDRESLSDSGEVNRRTVIHITAKERPTSNNPDSTDKNNNCKEDQYSDSYRCYKPLINKATFDSSVNGNHNSSTPISTQLNGYERKSRMFVRQSDSLNRPSRPSAFNVRQTIEKRQIQQERRERRALRKKIREQLRSSSVGRKDINSSSWSICSSETSNISKSLNSLDDNEEINNLADPLIKAQSNPTLESDKKPIRSYLFGTNLTTEPSSTSTSKNIIERVRNNVHETPVDIDRESFNSSSNNFPRVPTVTQGNSRASLSDNFINTAGSNTNYKYKFSGSVDSTLVERSDLQTSTVENSRNKNSFEYQEECLPVPPPRRRSRISSSVGQLTVEKNEKPSWLRQAKERRSLRNERRPFENLSESTESVTASEPDWVGKARKKLEYMNVFLTSTTDTLSVSSVVSDSSAWSRGGLDALEDLKEEVGRMSDVLSEEALLKVEADLGLHYKDKNMIEYPSIPEHPNEQQNYPLTASDFHEKDEVKFGDLKHDWGGIQSGRRVSKSNANLPHDSFGKENRNKTYNQNISNKFDLHNKEGKKTPVNEKLKLTHFGDCPQDLVSKQPVNLLNQKSSKFESIRGPNPLTMSAEQLNQNVEEYDFPVPTGKEDSQTLLKILEMSLKKEEAVPEFTSDAENEPKPKSILKRRSHQAKKNVNNLTNEGRTLDSSRKHPSSTDKYEPANDTNSKKRLYKSEKYHREFQPHTIVYDSSNYEKDPRTDRSHTKTRTGASRVLNSPITDESLNKLTNRESRYSKVNRGNHINSLYNQIYGSDKIEQNLDNDKKFRENEKSINQTIRNNKINLKLSEWEELQRQRLETDERNKMNTSTYIRPVSDKIKDLIRLHAGIKNVFSKDKNSNYNGTVNAKEIIFQKIPSADSNREHIKNYKTVTNSGNRSDPLVKPYLKSHETEIPSNLGKQGKLKSLKEHPETLTSHISSSKKPLSTYLFNVPDAFSKIANFDKLNPKQSLGSSYSKRNNESPIKKTNPFGVPFSTNNDKEKSATIIEKEIIKDTNPLSLGNRNSIYRSSYPAYTPTTKRLSDYNRANEDPKDLKYGGYDRLQNSEKCLKLDSMEDKKKYDDYDNNLNTNHTSSKYRFLNPNTIPISKLTLSEETETSKENICPNSETYRSKCSYNKDIISDHLNSTYDSFDDLIAPPRESLEGISNKRRSLTRIQNLRDRKYSPLERCSSPFALSDKSYLLDRNRSGSLFSRMSWSSRDRRNSLRSASSLRSTPDREGPISLSSILGRDTCSPYSSSSHLPASEEFGKLSSRYRRNIIDTDSPSCTNISDNENVFSDSQPQFTFQRQKKIQKDSLKRKSPDTLTSNGKKLHTKSSSKQVKTYLSSRKTPPRNFDRRSPSSDRFSRILEKDSSKMKDRKITKRSIDKLSTPKSIVAVNRKEKLKRFDSGASAKSERDEECEYYENINSSGEGWSKTKIKKTRLGKPLREKRSISRENSGSSINSRHVKKDSAELEKWAAQIRISGKLVNKEGQRYSHEVEEEEKEGKKSAKAVSRKVVRRGSRRLLKGGEIVSETKEIAKDVPSKPPKALHRGQSNDQCSNASLELYVPKDDITRKLKTKTDGERFTTTSVKTVKGINTTTTEGVDNKTTKSVEVIGGRGWEGEREVDGRHGERVVVERHIGKGLRPSTVIKKASSNSKIITTKTKKKSAYT